MKLRLVSHSRHELVPNLLELLVADDTGHRRRPLQWANACLYSSIFSKFIFLFGRNSVQQISTQYAETLVKIEKITEKKAVLLLLA